MKRKSEKLVPCPLPHEDPTLNKNLLKNNVKAITVGERNKKPQASSLFPNPPHHTHTQARGTVNATMLRVSLLWYWGIFFLQQL